MASKVGRPKNPPTPKELLKEVIPTVDLFDTDELSIYNSLVDIYVKDFDDNELKAADLDDIMTLATNKVLEIRLLRTSKGNPDRQLDITTSIEKMRKQSEKIKENLSARRRDRINPNEYKGFSIVDLAYAYNKERQSKMDNKSKELKKEQDKMLEKLKNTPGNRYDNDGDGKEE